MNIGAGLPSGLPDAGFHFILPLILLDVEFLNEYDRRAWPHPQASIIHELLVLTSFIDKIRLFDQEECRQGPQPTLFRLPPLRRVN